MIGFLRGEVLSPSLILDASGVGWKVACPNALVVGERVDLLVTTIVREDAISLFGFDTVEQQDLFAALRAVPGVGPALALQLIAALGTGPLAAAIASRDAKALSSVRGVGAKLADKVVALCVLPPALVSLASSASASSASSAAQSFSSAPDDPLVAALVGLGLDGPSARAALERARAAVGADASEALLLRTALRS